MQHNKFDKDKKMTVSKASARKEARVPIILRVNYTIGLQHFIDFAEDLSHNGMFIHTTTPAPKGTVLFVNVPCQGGEMLSLKAEVAWARERAEAGAARGMGVKFLDIGALEKGKLDKLINTTGR